ncbi:MAG: hypothetical protein ACK2TZ_02155, partial [Anaerolineales bacterium]
RFFALGNDSRGKRSLPLWVGAHSGFWHNRLRKNTMVAPGCVGDEAQVLLWSPPQYDFPFQ